MKQPHPAYGLTDEFRLQVLDTARKVGVRAAAGIHAVSTASIYNWRKWQLGHQHTAGWLQEVQTLIVFWGFTRTRQRLHMSSNELHRLVTQAEQRGIGAVALEQQKQWAAERGVHMEVKRVRHRKNK